MLPRRMIGCDGTMPLLFALLCRMWKAQMYFECQSTLLVGTLGRIQQHTDRRSDNIVSRDAGIPKSIIGKRQVESILSRICRASIKVGTIVLPYHYRCVASSTYLTYTGAPITHPIFSESVQVPRACPLMSARNALPTQSFHCSYTPSCRCPKHLHSSR